MENREPSYTVSGNVNWYNYSPNQKMSRRPEHTFAASLITQKVKNLSASAEDPGSMPGLGKSPGEGNGNPLQYSCLENSMDRAWGQKESDMTERLSHSHCGEQYGGSRKTKVELPYGPAISLLGLYPEKRKKVKWISRVQLFVTSRTVANQTPLSMVFSRQEYRSGLSFPSPGDLPDPGVKPWFPALQADSLASEPLGKRND